MSNSRPVRVAAVEPWPGRLRDGGFAISRFLVLLADDAAGRALPIWLSGTDGDALWQQTLWQQTAWQQAPWQLTGLPDAGLAPARTAEALAGRLLAAAGVSVTAVQLDDLDPAVTVAPEDPVADPPPATARITLAGAGAGGGGGPAGPLAVRLGYALALAAAAGAPVLVSGAVLDRLALAGIGDDLPAMLLARVPGPATARFGPRPRFEPRNLDFADGLDRWEFGGSFRRAADGGHERDYACSAADQQAVISAAVAEPSGFAALQQTIAADDYRGGAVVFGAEIRASGLGGRAGLRLHVGPPQRPIEGPRPAEPRHVTATVAERTDWVRYEVAAEVPDDAGLIQFGVFLAGAGRIEVRRAELARDQRARDRPGG